MVSSDVPDGSLKMSGVKPWSCGAEPAMSLTKMTMTRTTMRITEIPSKPSSERVATRMSP
jgi:hypothetical protein